MHSSSAVILAKPVVAPSTLFLALAAASSSNLAEDRPDDFVLIRKVLIDRGWAKLAGGDDLSHRGSVDSAFVEQLFGGAENPPPLSITMSVVSIRLWR